MNDIKEKLIHLLGGFTKDEHRVLQRYEYECGLLKSCDYVMEIMKKAYGMPADQWVEYVYAETEDFRDYCERRCDRCKSDLEKHKLL